MQVMLVCRNYAMFVVASRALCLPGGPQRWDGCLDIVKDVSFEPSIMCNDHLKGDERI